YTKLYQNIQIFETINPSILFMCPSSNSLVISKRILQI
ncbi:hypothetical protein LEP1GSC170_2575, partial [Leptospira interrogans serovar Bataviae str. HAI135]